MTRRYDTRLVFATSAQSVFVLQGQNYVKPNKGLYYFYH